MEPIFLLKDEEEEEEKKRIKFFFSPSLSSKVGQEVFHKIQNFPTIKKVIQFHLKKKNISYNYKSLEVFFL